MDNPTTIAPFPPVVSVLGHVDHGKTTLLDAIRKTTIATKEHGGITQKIGATSIEILHEGKKRNITFIDTPGHEAFSAMRSQGIAAADIVLLVVAQDDGIKPQTKEAIDKILESRLPFIVVLTKADLETASPERVKQQLMSTGVALEGLGGNVPSISVSSKTNQGIHELLDLILLIHDMSLTEKKPNPEFIGIVIDSKQDKKQGIIVSLIIKSGNAGIGEKAYILNKPIGKFKAIFDTSLSRIKTASCGDAIEVLGFEEILPMGTLVFTKEKVALPQVLTPQGIARPEIHDLAKFFGEKPKDVIPLIIKTQSSGEFEAIQKSLPEKTEIVYSNVGDISVSDVLMAKDFGARVLGFNVSIADTAATIAKTENVFYKTYSIIYKLLEEVNEALAGNIEKTITPSGVAEIMAKFEGNNSPILGIKVRKGKLAIGDKVQLLRSDLLIGEAKIISLKKGKQDTQTIVAGLEGGVQLLPTLDFAVGDMLSSHK